MTMGSAMLGRARRALQRLKRRWGGREPVSKEAAVVTLLPVGPVRGRALLSYIIEPFLVPPGQPLPQGHTRYWESYEIAQICLALGFAVDAISWKNATFLPQQRYTLFVDVRNNLERLAPRLNPDCITIFHSDTAHILFHNAAESRRLLELQQRRGVTLRPRRFELPNLALEHADYGLIKGNDFTLGTYRYAGKPLFQITGTPISLFPAPADKDFAACRRQFLFFSSGGMVHKGLDRVLEAFAAMPQYELTICGPVAQEESFVAAYHAELRQTPNIHLQGWIDVNGAEFAALIARCVALVYPSCSEGQSGSVITCLHAGLIPIVSHESGVDVTPDFGVLLRESSVAEIQQAVEQVASLPPARLREMALAGWAQAQAGYSQARFSAQFRQALETILAERGA